LYRFKKIRIGERRQPTRPDFVLFIYDPFRVALSTPPWPLDWKETGMMHRAQLRLLFHGNLFLLIGLLSGVPYLFGIVQGWSAEEVHGWHFAHTALSVGSVWMIAVAGVLSLLTVGTSTLAVLVWSLLLCGYGFSIGIVLSAIAGVRGLEPCGPPLNLVAFVANMVGIGGALANVVLMTTAAYSSLKRLGKPDVTP
jgi:hypothetical protein